MKRKIILSALLIVISINVGHAQDYQYLQSMLDRANAQFQEGVDNVAGGYHYLRDLQLINRYNIPRLEEYKRKVQEWMKTSGASSLDYSIPSNVSSVCAVINGYLNDKDIKDEIDLLTSLNSEMQKLKYRDPENFTKSSRYKELMQVVDELSTCSNNDIRSLALKHGLF